MCATGKVGALVNLWNLFLFFFFSLYAVLPWPHTGLLKNIRHKGHQEHVCVWNPFLHKRPKISSNFLCCGSSKRMTREYESHRCMPKHFRGYYDQRPTALSSSLATLTSAGDASSHGTNAASVKSFDTITTSHATIKRIPNKKALIAQGAQLQR